jgi:2-phosphosulfolactate phosphatase
MTFDQSEFDVRCEWGENGVSQLAPISDAVIIVDVLSFSTCVEIATNREAIVFPYRWRDETAAKFAASVVAELAGGRSGDARYSLSPQSLLGIPQGTRLVLPSPNGSTLTLGTGETPTLAGCLRNYRAVALAAQKYGKRVSIIPAGERWSDGSLRPAFEDWIGAGAIISELNGSLSPEARAAFAAFRYTQAETESLVKQCGSGKELIARGFEEDVVLAAAVDVSACVPTLVNGAYVQAEG